MAIKVDFTGIKTMPPSGDGPTKCSKCGGKAYATYGQSQDGKAFYSEWCQEGFNFLEPEKSIPCKGVNPATI